VDRTRNLARPAFSGLVLACALLLPVGSAGASSKWGSLRTSGQLGLSDLVGTARGAHGTLHVAWQRRTTDGLFDLLQTPVGKGGAVGSPTSIVTGWASIEGPTLLTANGQLFAYFSGTQTLITGDPHEGVDVATSQDDGRTWDLFPSAVAVGDFASSRDASVAAGPGGHIISWYAGEETVTHLSGQGSTNQRGFGSGTGQAVAVSGGSALVAWCTSVQGPNGVFVQPVDPRTAGPAGPARIVPGSTSSVGGVAESFCPASTRVPLVARQGKGFFVATVDGRRRTVHGWNVGAPRSLTLAGGSSFKQHVAAAASPARKASVWVGWMAEDGRVELRRSNAAAKVFGATVTLAGPRDGSIAGLDLDAQRDRVDVVARVEHDDGTIGLEHTQSYPGLTLVAHGGKRPSFRVLDAGDPVRHAKVSVAGQSAPTDREGRVTIPVRRPGRYTAHATAPKYVGAKAAVRVARH
jgi:hypothetical protein